MDRNFYNNLILENLSPGRIKNIIDLLKKIHKVDAIVDIPAEDKLNLMCEVLQLSIEDFDQLISNNPQVIRTVKGHAFEAVFDNILKLNGYNVSEVGGDDSVDRIVNGYSLQLKTPNMAGTKGTLVEYKTHKTHGPKSEMESMSYYQSKSEFADFLVGLISYEPFKVIIIPKDSLPGHLLDNDRIISPFKINWEDNEYVNAFHLIGVNHIDLSTEHIKPNPMGELLPRSSLKINLPSEIIIDTILNENNFRIWDMNMRGFAREKAFRKYLQENNVTPLSPNGIKLERTDKVDISLKLRNIQEFIHLQVKGLTFSSSKFNKRDSIIDIESQLSRGRVNDHETQSRLYLETDFDYLVLCLDPCYSAMFLEEIGETPSLEWQFYAIPNEKLLRHKTFTRRIKSHQKYNYIELQQYRIDSSWLINFS